MGWEFHIQAGYIVHPMIKRAKLVDLIQKLLFITAQKKSLERFLGLLWATQLLASYAHVAALLVQRFAFHPS